MTQKKSFEEPNLILKWHEETSICFGRKTTFIILNKYELQETFHHRKVVEFVFQKKLRTSVLLCINSPLS